MAPNDADMSSAQTPARSSNKSAGPAPSSEKQRSIMSFFQKSSPGGPLSSPAARVKVSPNPKRSSCLQETTRANTLPKPRAKPSVKLATPTPSSDAVDLPSSQENADPALGTEEKASRLAAIEMKPDTKAPKEAASSPSRKVGFHPVSFSPHPHENASRLRVRIIADLCFAQARKVISYAESSEDDEPFNYGKLSRPRRRGRAAPVMQSEDEYDANGAASGADNDGRFPEMFRWKKKFEVLTARNR